MSDVRIKICGVRDPHTAHVVKEAGAQYLGLVFAEGSPRQVTIDEAHRVIDSMSELGQPRDVDPVALFSDQPIEFVEQVLTATAIEIVQLHGDEDREYVEHLAPLGVQIWKAVPCQVKRFEVWRNPPSNVTGLLVDTPRRGKVKGGSGRTFDWSKLDNVDRAGLPPIILAGGLGPDNVADAIAQVDPWMVDVSSGVESSRGVKDASLIQAFCEAVRSAESPA